MKGIKIKPGTLQLSLSLFMALLLSLPTIAQNKVSQGGLFGLGPGLNQMNSMERGGLIDPTGSGFNIGTQLFGEINDGGFNIGTQQFGQEAPLAGGWLVLTIAGVAYAFKKRKNSNK